MRARLSVTLLLLLTMLIVAPAGLAQPAASSADVTFEQGSASADFPQSMTFEIELRSAVEIERLQLFWSIAGASTTTMADVQFTGSTDIEASHTIDTTIQYVPPGLDIEHYWIATATDGETLQSGTGVFTYMDDRFDWESVEAGLITVFWYRGTNEFAAEVAHSANRTLAMLQAEYGLATTEPIRIFVYGSGNDFSSALRPNSADWIGGVAYSSLSLIIVNIQPGANASREINRMIPHEISHVVVHHAAENPYNSPQPWLDEGLATFIQEASDQRLEPTLDRAVREGRLIPVGALRSSFPVDPDQALLSYAQSESIVRYLIETYGTRRVGELVTVYQTEVSHDDAVESVLGITIDELDAAWKSWLGYEGDQVDDAFAAASDPPGPGRWWFIVGFGAASFFAGGLVAYFFWKTRSYAISDETDDTPEHVA